MKTIKIFLVLAFVCSFSYAGIDSIFVKIQGDTVTIWHKNAGSQCAAKFVFDVSVLNDTIAVIERDTSKAHADCRCTFDLNVAIRNLQAGNYFVMVYRQELKIYNFDKDTTFFIGSTNFTVTGTNLLPYFSYSMYQSGCGGVPVGVERKETSPPQSIRLTNHPNPFNSLTTISFFIPEGFSHSTVELIVYDEQGRQVKQLLKSVLPSGEHAVRWDGTNEKGAVAASGVYFYHLVVGSQRQIGKMSLVK